MQLYPDHLYTISIRLSEDRSDVVHSVYQLFLLYRLLRSLFRHQFLISHLHVPMLVTDERTCHTLGVLSYASGSTGDTSDKPHVMLNCLF